MLEGSAHINPSALSDPEAHGKKIAAVSARLEIEPIAIHANFVLGDANLFPGLTTADAAARKYLATQMEAYFFGAGADVAAGYVKPGSK